MQPSLRNTVDTDRRKTCSCRQCASSPSRSTSSPPPAPTIPLQVRASCLLVHYKLRRQKRNCCARQGAENSSGLQENTALPESIGTARLPRHFIVTEKILSIPRIVRRGFSGAAVRLGVVQFPWWSGQRRGGAAVPHLWRVRAQTPAQYGRLVLWWLRGAGHGRV